MLTGELIEQMKVKLLSEKGRLEQELSKIGKRNEDQGGGYRAQWEEYGSSDEENAAEVTDYTNSLSLAHELEQELDAVEQSLADIQSGTYGKCAQCGAAIDEKRLMARPMSRLCITCQQKSEL